MRSIKLLGAVGAASLFAIAPAGASAKHAGASGVAGGCRPTIEAESPITYGDSVTIRGELCASGSSAASSTVTVFERVARSPVKKGASVGAPVMSGNKYEFTATPAFNTTFWVVQGGARSIDKTVLVAPAVTVSEKPSETSPLITGRVLFLSHHAARSINLYKFIGNVKPCENGEVVALQRESSIANEEWHRIALGSVNSCNAATNEGKFTVSHVFGAPGDANLRVVAHPKTANAFGASTPMSYVIDQPQNPQLEIEVKPEPITFGESATIKGKAPGASSVTLWSRSPGHGKFSQVGGPVSVTGGTYEFPAQKPTGNTSYQVRDSVTRSAIVFEAVKYVLTASAPASTVQAGMPVEYKGKVTPSPTEVKHAEIIYLERQNASGIGFHVVEVALVGANGEYTISHAFFGFANPAKLRVKIPGNPELQGVGSAISTVTITPPPPGTPLRPIQPSKQPGEGSL